MTDSDLQEARKAFNDRIYGKRPRARLGRAGMAAAAAVVLAGAGIAGFLVLGGDDDRASQPANSVPSISDPDADFLVGDAPTANAIAGVWRVDNGRILLTFNQDGTVRFDDRGTLFSHPVTTGTYVIAGDLITVTTTDDAQAGCAGTRYAMRASLPAAGSLRFVTSQARFGPCSPMPLGRGALEQVLPASASISGFVFSQDPGWQPLSDKAVLYGVWSAEGGGHVLEIDAGGAYFVAGASGEPVDRGAWSLRGTVLTLTSSAQSTACTAGDQLVLNGLQQNTIRNTAGLRGTVQKNACAGAWTPKAWFLLPNKNS